MKKLVNILGTQYTIKFGKESEYPNLADNDGYIDTSTKEIVIDDMTTNENDIARKKNIEAYKKQVLRHEIIHAFLAESGLDGNGSFSGHWECNEEMVDWFAIQSPKIIKAFFESEALSRDDIWHGIYIGSITADKISVDEIPKQIERCQKTTFEESVC